MAMAHLIEIKRNENLCLAFVCLDASTGDSLLDGPPNFFRLEREFARPFCAGKKNAPPQDPRKMGAETGFAPLRSFGRLPLPYAPIRWPKGGPVLDPDPHCQTQRSLPSRSISTPFRPGCLNYDRPDPDTSALESGILGRPGLCSTALGVDAATPRCHRDILQWICTRGQRKP